MLGGVTLQERQPGATGGLIRSWAEWNYSGLEAKPEWPAFRDLVMPLRGTPGRLANDLSDENTRLGSSRIFESVPHLTGKPILEGGLVNSAAGALFAYYIQSETSQSCAGYPPMMMPASFNITNATRHLELFNVKHLMARWPVLQQALAASPDWRRVGSAGGWDLYELLTHDGRYVQVLDEDPPALVTADWKRRALDWFYEPAALSAPVLLVPPGGRVPAGTRSITQAEFAERIATAGTGTRLPIAPRPSTFSPVLSESVTDDRIVFETEAIGRPHMIKINWFPNWRVSGADAVYRVTPDFLLVVPRQRHVELTFGLTPVDRIGLALAWLGWGVIAIVLVRRTWRWVRRLPA